MLGSGHDLGIVPIENSSGGTVYDSVDLLIRHARRIFIWEELALDVRIALLGHRGQAVKTVFSHFVQIKHHAEWLKLRHPKARLHALASTALAAQKAAQSKGARRRLAGAADVPAGSPRNAGSRQPERDPLSYRGASEMPDQDRKDILVAAPNVAVYRSLGPCAAAGIFADRFAAAGSRNLLFSSWRLRAVPALRWSPVPCSRPARSPSP